MAKKVALHPHTHHALAIVGIVAIIALLISFTVAAQGSQGRDNDAQKTIQSWRAQWDSLRWHGNAPPRNSSAQAQIDVLNSRVDALEAQSSLLQTQVSTLQSQVATLQGQVTDLTSDVSVLKAAPPPVQIVQQVTTLQTQVSSATIDIDAIKAQIAAALDCGGGYTLCHGSCMQLNGAACQ